MLHLCPRCFCGYYNTTLGNESYIRIFFQHISAQAHKIKQEQNTYKGTSTHLLPTGKCNGEV